MPKSVIGFGIALISFAMMPAHADVINLSCGSGNPMRTETDRYQIDLDGRTATLTGESIYMQGQLRDFAEKTTFPITKINDQYIVWDDTYNGQDVGVSHRLDRSTLTLSFRNNSHVAYHDIMNCKILHKQF
jgi:hypothetical protein